MPLMFHDFGKRGMTVFDEKRCVAVARYWRSFSVWQLRLHDASWANTMTNDDQKLRYKRLGLPANIAPFLTSVKTYREAKRIMREIAGMHHAPHQ